MRENMEEPRTPSNEMWWQLMGDDPMSPRRRPRTPITPRSFASLWTSPEGTPEKGSDSNKNSKSEATKSLSSKKSSKSKQRRKNADENRSANTSVDNPFQDLQEPDHLEHRRNKNSEVTFDDETLRKMSPIERITMAHPEQKLATSPLSERSKKRYASTGSDAFDDNGSYVEGTTEKFLDILEERICSPTAPSICEIEKRIEESWKEIENKTSQFFRFRKSGSQSNMICASSDQTLHHQQAETQEDMELKSEILPTCAAGKQYECKNDGDDTDRPPVSAYESAESKDSRDVEEFLDDDDDDDDEEEDEEEDNEEDEVESRHQRESKVLGPRRPGHDSDFWDDDADGESTIRDTADLNSYTDAYMKILKERRGAVSAIAQSESMLSLGSMEYDASTLTTIPTESLITLPTIPTESLATLPPITSLDTPSVVITSTPPQPTENKSSKKTSKTKGTTSLTVFEPTHPSALLLKNHAFKKSVKDSGPVRLPAGGAIGDHYVQMPDLDQNFQKTCFSPHLWKKKGLSFGNIKSTLTGSTEQSNRSQKSLDSKGEASVSGNHAYIAYFERGTAAKGVFRLYEHPTPSSFPTLNQEIVIRINYSTISHTDCAVRRGTYWGSDSLQPLSLPIIPGVSFSGYVTQLNRRAMRSGMRYGDQVISLVRKGANARHLCIDRDEVVIVPDELKDEKMVACLPEIYLGAFQVLHMGQRNGARYKKSSLAGKSILILGGATILGKALIELSHTAGAYAVYATGKQRHFPAIEAANATPINRDPRHWYSLLKDRIDLIVGLDNESFGHSEASAQHLEVLSAKGRAVLFGAPENTCNTAIDKHKKIFVYNVFDSWDKDLKQAKRDLSHLCKLLVEGAINPNILETIPLGQIAEAQDAVEDRDFSAFLLCDPWSPTKREAEKIVPRTVMYSDIIGSSSKETTKYIEQRKKSGKEIPKLTTEEFVSSK